VGAAGVDLQDTDRLIGVMEGDADHRHGAQPATQVDVNPGVGRGVVAQKRLAGCHTCPRKAARAIEANADVVSGRSYGNAVDHLVPLCDLDHACVRVGQLSGSCDDTFHDLVEIESCLDDLVLRRDDRAQVRFVRQVSG
jgi:hypothetical protein